MGLKVNFQQGRYIMPGRVGVNGFLHYFSGFTVLRDGQIRFKVVSSTPLNTGQVIRNKCKVQAIAADIQALEFYAI